MPEIKQNENEPLEHYELRSVAGNEGDRAPHNSRPARKWVAESRIAQEICTVLVQHPQYYEEFRTFVGGIFPEPIR